MAAEFRNSTSNPEKAFQMVPKFDSLAEANIFWQVGVSISKTKTKNSNYFVIYNLIKIAN
jgi:hypothetical protein